ncbi:MAG TPA: FAD-binding oxidoreductase, partial [Acidimicrobiales bacterium]|nr:FAD-binding oxidoreductase [Acidimicrobiales bacterium]
MSTPSSSEPGDLPVTGFRGRAARARPGEIDAIAQYRLDARMQALARQHREAMVEAVETVATGTVRVRLRATDGRPLHFAPGQFVSVHVERPGEEPRRRPYCPLSAPDPHGRFELLVRLVG